MNYREGYSFFDRQELLEKARLLHQELFGKRPDADIYSGWVDDGWKTYVISSVILN